MYRDLLGEVKLQYYLRHAHDRQNGCGLVTGKAGIAVDGGLCDAESGNDSMVDKSN